jgi:hypothetical protein
MKTNWNKLRMAIGVSIILASEYQMTAEGMTKISETRADYFGEVAECSAGGRPILNAATLQQHSVGVPGQADVIWDPLYDSLAYPSAGSLTFSFYSNPIGQGTSSTPGAGAVSKTIYDTNLTIGNQLTSGNNFYMIGSENLFFPGVNNSTVATTAFAVEPGRANVATTTGIFVNDVYNVGNGGNKVMTVGTDRAYVTDGPLNLFPPATRLAGFAGLAGQGGAAATGSGQEVSYAAWSGELYTIAPIYIVANQNWTMQLTFAALIPTPSAQIGRLIDRMRGYLIRQAT